MPATLPFPAPLTETKAMLNAMYDETGELPAVRRVEISVVKPGTLRWTIGTENNDQAWSFLSDAARMDSYLASIRLLLAGSAE